MRIRTVTFDCHDQFAQARFWSEALGYTDDPDNPNNPGDPETLIIDPSGRRPRLLFLPVPEEKTVKNRMHLDLEPDVDSGAEVARLVALGASVVAEHRPPSEPGWIVMSDPEGNEFCVTASPAERAAFSSSS